MKMGNYKTLLLLFFLVSLNLWAGLPDGVARRQYVIPEKMYGRLFYDVMACDTLFGPGKLFVESKTFVDMVPRQLLSAILHHYDVECGQDLGGFLTRHFVIPQPVEREGLGKTGDIDSYIKSLWSFLTCRPDAPQEGTLIAMKHDYFVPGGRFREMYYWDSYFSMLGMLCDNQDTLVVNMLDNFAHVIDEIGFIPNGMRTYYLSRSQPPFFSFMLEDAAKKMGNHIYLKYLSQLEKEYRFWMTGADSVSAAHPACRRVVRMPDGELLNRYYDNLATPRPEAYRNDIETGKELLRAVPTADVTALYRELRASAESGLDFSSRWMADGKSLHSLRTTSIVPVDLNCLLHHIEVMLARAYRYDGNRLKEKQYRSLAKVRAKAIRKYFWSASDGFFKDYVWTTRSLSPYESLAGVFPLFCGVATKRQAVATETTINAKFMRAGGVVTTPYHTGQQWDAPNGWAPLEWITYKGLTRYKLRGTANTLRERWMNTCKKVFLNTGKMLEKYDVERQANTGGGEYSNQTGFGWTNGVYRAMELEQLRK